MALVNPDPEPNVRGLCSTVCQMVIGDPGVGLQDLYSPSTR